MLLGGASLASVARLCDCSTDAVSRHKAAHVHYQLAVSEKVAAKLAGEELYEIVIDLLTKSRRILADTEKTKPMTALAAVAQSRETIKYLSDLEFRLRELRLAESMQPSERLDFTRLTDDELNQVLKAAEILERIKPGNVGRPPTQWQPALSTTGPNVNVSQGSEQPAQRQGLRRTTRPASDRPGPSQSVEKVSLEPLPDAESDRDRLARESQEREGRATFAQRMRVAAFDAPIERPAVPDHLSIMLEQERGPEVGPGGSPFKREYKED